MSEQQIKQDEQSDFSEILLSLDYDYHEEDLFLGACAIDLKNKLDTRRNLEAVALVVILWVFIPQTVEQPTQILNWLMVIAATVLILMLWKYPEIQNRKFAKNKVQQSPKVHLDFTAKQIEIQEGTTHYTAEYAAKTQVCESEEVFAISHNKGYVLVIPKKQLSAEQNEQLYQVLSDGFGSPPVRVQQKSGWFCASKKNKT